jgi:hypothetical protein
MRHRITLPLPLMTLRSGLLSVWQNSRRVSSTASLTSATTQSARHVSAYPGEPTLREGSNPSSGTTTYATRGTLGEVRFDPGSTPAKAAPAGALAWWAGLGSSSCGVQGLQFILRAAEARS